MFSKTKIPFTWRRTAGHQPSKQKKKKKTSLKIPSKFKPTRYFLSFRLKTSLEREKKKNTLTWPLLHQSPIQVAKHTNIFTKQLDIGIKNLQPEISVSIANFLFIGDLAASITQKQPQIRNKGRHFKRKIRIKRPKRRGIHWK